MFLRKLDHTGDTIVEVMVAIIVVGSVLAGAYVSSNHSLNANRQSQERSEALKYVEGQIETIKANVGDLYNHSGPWCLNASGGRVDLPVAPPANYIADNWSEPYPGDCMKGSSNRYHLFVSHTSGSDTYTVNARWDRAGGGGKEQAAIVYKVSP